MNICLVSFELPPSGGGEGTYTYNLAKGLSSSGQKVVIVTPLEVARLSSRELNLDNITLKPIRIVSRPFVRVSSFISGAIREMPKTVIDYNIDLVHFTFDYPPYPFDISGIGVPVCATLHHLHIAEVFNSLSHNKTSLFSFPNIVRQLLLSESEKRLLKQSSAVIAVSEFTYDSAIRYARISPENLRIVPNGIDMNAFAQENSAHDEVFRKKYGLSSGRLVLYVGRIEESKGLEFLIRGFAKVVSQLDGVKLVIVGSGSSSYLERLRRVAANLGILDYVIFTGRINQSLLLGAYKCSDVVILPSLMEGFGLTILEAMSTGKPVIATRVGAVPEIVESGKTGLLVEPGRSEEMGIKILQLLENPIAAKEMGERGKVAITNRFTIENMAKLTEKVYSEVLQKKIE